MDQPDVGKSSTGIRRASYNTQFNVLIGIDLHELILYVSEGFLLLLLCIYNVCMGTFDLHGLILYVSEGVLS